MLQLKDVYQINLISKTGSGRFKNENERGPSREILSFELVAGVDNTKDSERSTNTPVYPRNCKRRAQPQWLMAFQRLSHSFSQDSLGSGKPRVRSGELCGHSLRVSESLLNACCAIIRLEPFLNPLSFVKRALRRGWYTAHPESKHSEYWLLQSALDSPARHSTRGDGSYYYC